MVLEWTMPAAVGLMVGISVGVLIEMKYIIGMDRKIEHLIEKVARIELRTEHELLSALKKKKANKRR
ncbi:MAG: hypothetical protein PHC66_03450 [Candidatus Nanoarchaeia archaeon]|nr:hypothetical protein [Candidatus Nanoarchaeia archaeon]MDD5239792.1 hypothetical protein [Candidatus Nanoarchaeia archaeon]